MRSWGQLAECEAMLARVALEPGWQQGEHEVLTLFTQTLLAKAREILLLTGQLQRNCAALEAELPMPLRAWLDEHQARLGAWLVSYAARLNDQAVALDGLPPLDPPAEGSRDDFGLLRELQELHRLLVSLPDWPSFENGTLVELRS